MAGPLIKTVSLFRRFFTRLRRVFTLEGYALSPIWLQVLVLCALCAAAIVAFSYTVGGIRQSIFSFFSPADAVIQPATDMRWSVPESIIGVMFSAFLISLFTSALDRFIDGIRFGTVGFKKSNHIIIINNNRKLPYILEEMNRKYEDLYSETSVVVLLKNREKVVKLRDQMKSWHLPHLNLYFRQGNALRMESLRRISACSTLGMVILSDEDIGDPKISDNHNLKILSTLVSDEKYRSYVVDKKVKLKPRKCLVEIEENRISRRIVEHQTTLKGNKPFFQAVNAEYVLDKVLSRAIIDMLYYRIYSGVFSFSGHEVYFIDPSKYLKKRHAAMIGKSFDELHLRFTKSVLLGFSRTIDKLGNIEVEINPCMKKGEKGIWQTLGEKDWLVLLAENEQNIEYDDSGSDYGSVGDEEISIAPPHEEVHQNVCMLGRHHDFQYLKKFLDSESRIDTVDREAAEDYYDDEMINRVRQERYGHVIVNLDDQDAFKLTMYLHAAFSKRDPEFLDRVITILEDPTTEEILRKATGSDNIILSDKLAAQFMTQVVFQKNIYQILDELISPEGYEFYIISMDDRLRTRSKVEMKRILLENRMSYVGVVDQAGEVVIDGDDFGSARQLIVLHEGEARSLNAREQVL